MTGTAVSEPTYVSLDLETTGTNPQNDRIVEIGAVRFTPTRVIETFQAFVNPGRELPFRVQVLTGISNDDLAAAPRIEVVAGQFEEFVGSSPVVGQSVDFDLAFLQYANIHLVGPVYDTFEIASLFLPEARDYGLRALADFLEIPFPVRHRALEDAEAAREVFLALRTRMADLPDALLNEILRLSSRLEWPLRGLLEELTGGPQALIPAAPQPGAIGMPTTVDEPVGLAPTDRRTPVQPEEAARYLRNAGKHNAIEDFEDRPQQLRMAEAVAKSFGSGQHLAVEAGTGTGKSLAYLVPAALHALRNGERVVISTDTIGLQEQLIGKDIPVVRRVLEDAPGVDGLRTAT